MSCRCAHGLAGSDAIDEFHLRVDGTSSTGSAPRRGETRTPKPLTEDEAKLRKDLLVELERHQGSIPKVARAFGKARMQIHRWLKKFEIDAKAFRTR
jgi:transcriptional regulator of acetoin/glycerol metabolism